MAVLEMTGKTKDEAIAAACAQLGVEQDDLNVSVEILELPVKKLFRTTPAKVRVTVEEPEAPAAAPVPEQAEEPAPKTVPEAPAAAQPVAQAAPAENAGDAGTETEEPIVIEENPKVQAVVEYLTEVCTAMGVSNMTFDAVQKGEATILKIAGENVGVLIGRRGETMESLSYLASLVANRMGGDYMKLGLDVAGYRSKRESDLETLAARIADKVIKSGRSHAMEPMNPYERRIIHSAISKLDGVRSESKGEGQDRRVVIYSTDPNASNLPDRGEGRGSSRGPRSNGNRGNGARSGGYRGGSNNRGPRGNGNRGGQRSGGYRGGERSSGGFRGGNRDEYRAPRTSTPEREFANETRDPNAAPIAPKRSDRINDADGFALYGKIEL